MAAIFQDGGHFQHENLFLGSFILCDFYDLRIKSYIFDHAESEFRTPEFSKSLFYKIWDEELKYIMLVSMKCSFEWNVAEAA